MLFPLPTAPKLTGIARLAAGSPLLDARRSVEYFDLPARRLLNRADPRMPFDWGLNPYRGCEFGCRYCYARYTHEFMELDAAAFENRIYVKRFSAPAFRAELRRIPRGESIAIGTATDPYQPAERRFGITRAILETLAGDSGRSVSITTKSDLVARDLDLFKALAARNRVHVNLSISTLDARLARLLEPRAPLPSLRLAAVRRLADAGIETGVFPNPIMPCITDSEENLDSLAAAVKRAGTAFLYGGPLILRSCTRRVFFPFLERHFPDAVPRYRALFAAGPVLRGAWANLIQGRLARIRARHGLNDSPAAHSECVPDAQLSLFDES